MMMRSETHPPHYEIQEGARYPGGATLVPEGVNFSIFSRHARRVELLLFERADSPWSFQVIPLEARYHRTFFFWHVLVLALPAGSHYAWRIAGPHDTEQSGLRFDGEKLLLDPWARAVTNSLWHRRDACLPGDNTASAMRAVVVDNHYDWEGDEPLSVPPEQNIIYEMHVGGFTRHPSAGVHQAGTFLGLIEKIPYLQSLGITHVELLPVMAFDIQDLPPGATDLELENFWGYSTHSFYSPHPGYCVTPQQGSHVREFRDMVKALHRAGIGVIIDVVFNHTAEGGEGGPVINFKGIGNQAFYHLDPSNRSHYRDYIGCGNTVNCNHPLVAHFIIDCLEYWVREMHVDGFRFDLASVMSRGEDGTPLYHAPVLWNIEFSDTLIHSRIIAEAWDAAGLYQVGDFPGYRWAEWNGRYRDVIRRFVRGDQGLVRELASRITGSSDFYQPRDRLPANSINFVTCHDGFTLNDLVTYNHKYNEANGEDNRDGCNNNLSWNCGVEGPSDDEGINRLRQRQAKNFMAILLLSKGVPMLLAGDEVLRSQNGNNNSYCQNNELGWFDWSLLETNHSMLRFMQELIAFRKRHPALMHPRFLTGKAEPGQQLADITWHGTRLEHPPWDDHEAQTLAFTLSAVQADEPHLHVMLNMSAEAQVFQLPRIAGRCWYRAIDTFRPHPQTILTPSQQALQLAPSYRLQNLSVVVLEGR